MVKKIKNKTVHVPEVMPHKRAPEEHEQHEQLEQDPDEDFHEKEDSEDSDSDSRQLVEKAPTLESDPAELAADFDRIQPTVSSTDPLARYFAEIRKHPLLSADEEYRLATRLLKSGDINAAKGLVQANLRLVVKIAMDYRSYYSNFMDLIQEGNIGLMKAVSKYDPTKGARLGYYASWWIKSYILKYLLDNFRLVKIGTTQAQKKLFYHLMREKEKLEAQGLLAGPKLLAEKLQVREKDIIEMESRLSSRGSELALDAPIEASDGKRTHLDILADQAEPADELLSREQLLSMIRVKIPAFLETLNDKERRIFNDRMMADEPKTLQEVADFYKLTRERARQIEVKVLAKLKDFLRDELN